MYCTLIKKNIKISSYVGKFRVEHLQIHIWLTASSYMGKYLRISSFIRKPLLIYDTEFPYIWGKLDILFYQCIFSKYPCSVNCPKKMQIWTVSLFCLHYSDSIGKIYPCILLYFEPQTLLNGRLSPCSVCFPTQVPEKLICHLCGGGGKAGSAQKVI